MGMGMQAKSKLYQRVLQKIQNTSSIRSKIFLRIYCFHGVPQLFFLSNRVSKIELQAEISNEHNGRVFLIYGFDGEEQLEEAISRRAEDFHSQ